MDRETQGIGIKIMGELARIYPKEFEFLQNMDAEKKVLGAMIKDNHVIPFVLKFLNRHDFFQDSHQIIFDSIVDVFGENKPVNFDSLSEALRRKGVLYEIGGIEYLTELETQVLSPSNVENDIYIVCEISLRRKLFQEGSDISNMALTSPEDACKILSDAGIKLKEILEQQTNKTFKPLAPYLDNLFFKIEKNNLNTGLRTGFIDFDEFINGFQSGNLIILSAGPSIGKTSLVLNIAENIVIDGIPVGFFSLEMNKEQIAERILCSQSRVNNQHLKSGKLTKRDAAQLLQAVAKIHNMPLYIDDTSSLTIVDILQKIKRLKTLHPDIGMIVIDSLQLISRENRVHDPIEQIPEICRSLKLLARELRIPIIVCVGLELDEDRPPRISDLNNVGPIEQYADLVIFIHRELYLKELIEEEFFDKTTAQNTDYSPPYNYKLVIAKNRNGPIGEVDIYFAREYATFLNAVKPENYSDYSMSDSVMDRDSALWKDNREFFKRHEREFLKKYPGLFVAVHGQKVLGIGEDLGFLAGDVYKKYGDIPFYAEIPGYSELEMINLPKNF